MDGHGGLSPRVVGVALGLVALGLMACSTSSSEPAGSEESARYDLQNEPWAQAHVTARTGDLVELAVVVRQANDATSLCGRPTIKDPFNNTLIELAPRRTSTGSPEELLYTYRFAFYAATSGRYVAFLENRKCATAELWAVATATWTVTPAK